MKPHSFYILLALAEASHHGSAIEREVARLSEGRIKLWPVTLYGTLDELVAGGMIVEVAESDRPAGESGRKRYYRLTDHGRKALERESSHLAQLAAHTRMRLGIRS